MRTLIALLFAGLVGFSAKSQSIVGTWQLVSQTHCQEDDLEEAGEEDEEVAALVDDMKDMSDGTNSVIRFNDDHSGDESLRMFDSRKSSKKNKFLYKFTDNNLYILDKRSRLLLGSYEVERLTEDSLIFSNTRRACETRVFVRIADSH